jgi:hypothetical protein
MDNSNKQYNEYSFRGNVWLGNKTLEEIWSRFINNAKNA